MNLGNSDPIYTLYQLLYERYGPQGWWPLYKLRQENGDTEALRKGYHIGEYKLPQTPLEQFEIAIGAILTQNTTWLSVEKALDHLVKTEAIDPKILLKMSDEKLKEIIRPCGYHNQKSGYVKNFTRFFLELNDRTPDRKSLLEIKGIGPETADSILLYGYKQPEFVIDTYTRRVFEKLNLCSARSSYEQLKKQIEEALEGSLTSESQKVRLYQEYHALLVRHAKLFYSKKPHGSTCPLATQYKN